MNLPPLPERVSAFKYPTDEWAGGYYTADQMREYGQLCRQRALEEAAQKADEADKYNRFISREIARAVRSLIK